MNNTNGMNILFYSQKCETCKNLLVLLKNENLLGHFKLMCVDDKLNSLPQNMVVPTMFLVNINKPLVALEAFEWVKQMKFIRQQQILDINKKIIQQTSTHGDNIKKGPMGYDNIIMGSVSDKFSFTKNDNPLPQSYFGVNEENIHAIFTAPKEKEAISKSEQSKLIKELESRRTQQDSDYASFMKQQQINAVMQAEHEKISFNNQQLPNVNNNQQLMQQQMMQQQMMQNNIKR
jgi:hypothetical protein